jgi:hypothetical protein
MLIRNGQAITEVVEGKVNFAKHLFKYIEHLLKYIKAHFNV